MMKMSVIIGSAMLMAATHVMAGQRLNLKEVAEGQFREEAMAAVTPLSDGESYAQISKDSKQIVKYSFRTGQQTEVLFDVNTARGPRVERIDGYIMSPTGRRILIQQDGAADRKMIGD